MPLRMLGGMAMPHQGIIFFPKSLVIQILNFPNISDQIISFYNWVTKIQNF